MDQEVAAGPARPRVIAGLAVLWLAAAVLFPVAGARAYAESGHFPPGTIPLTVLSAALAYGLWTGRDWARLLQVLVLVPMACVLPFGLAAIILLGYVTRPETRRFFVASSGAPGWEGQNWTRSEWPWVLAVFAALILGVFLLVSMAPLFRAWG